MNQAGVIAPRKEVTMSTVLFSRLHLSGPLAGLTTQESVNFPTRSSADRYAAAVRRRKGFLDVRIVQP